VLAKRGMAFKQEIVFNIALTYSNIKIITFFVISSFRANLLSKRSVIYQFPEFYIDSQQCSHHCHINTSNHTHYTKT